MVKPQREIPAPFSIWLRAVSSPSSNENIPLACFFLPLWLWKFCGRDLHFFNPLNTCKDYIWGRVNELFGVTVPKFLLILIQKCKRTKIKIGYLMVNFSETHLGFDNTVSEITCFKDWSKKYWLGDSVCNNMFENTWKLKNC